MEIIQQELFFIKTCGGNSISVFNEMLYIDFKLYVETLYSEKVKAETPENTPIPNMPKIV